MSLPTPHLQLLSAMAHAHFLKSHRDINGNKSYQLHSLQGDSQPVSPKIVEHLRDNGYIDSNKKFPVATFWLTEKGKKALKP